MTDRSFGLSVGLCLAGVLVPDGPQSSAGPSETAPSRVLGLLLPPDTPERASILAGARAALQAIEGEPGVSLAVRGRRGPWGSDAAAAARLVAEDGAAALMGPGDGATAHLLLQVARRSRRPVALLCPDASVTRTGVPDVTRVVCRTEDEARLLLTALPAGRSAEAAPWGLVVPGGRAGSQVVEDLQAAATAVERRAVVWLRVAPSLPRIAELRTRLEDRPCDGIVLALAPGPAGRIARRLREAGFRGLLAGPGRLLCGEFDAAAGPAREGLLLAVPAALAAALERAPEEALPAGPGLTWAMAHDAATLLVRRLRADSSRAAPSLRAPRWMTGPPLFDPRGNRICALRLLMIRDGRLVPCSPRVSEAQAVLVPSGHR